MKLSRLIASTAAYGAIVAANSALRFVVLILAARLLLQEDYGRIDTLLIFGSVTMTLLLAGTDSALLRFVFDEDGREHGTKVLSNMIVVTVGTLGLVGLAAWAASAISPSAAQAMERWRVFAFCLPYGFGLALNALITTYLRATFQHVRFALMSVLSLALRAAPLGLLLLSGTQTLERFLDALALGAVLAGGVLVASLARDLSWRRVDRTLIQSALRYGIPLGGISFLAMFQPGLERALVDGSADALTLSVYAASAFPALLMGLSLQVINMVWAPLALRNWTDGEVRELRLSAYVMVVGLVGLYLLFLFAGQLVVDLFIPLGVAASARYFPFIGLIVLVRGFGTFTAFGFIIGKVSHVKLATAVLSVMTGAVAAWVLQSRLGIAGVPVGFFIGVFLGWTVEALIAARLADLDWPVARLGLLLAGLGALAFWIAF